MLSTCTTITPFSITMCTPTCWTLDGKSGDNMNIETEVICCSKDVISLQLSGPVVVGISTSLPPFMQWDTSVCVLF